MEDIQYISERVSISEKGGNLTIVVQANLGNSKNLLMFVWLLLWGLCGSYFIYQLFVGQLEQQLKIWIGVILSFWLYYFMKIAHVLLWRAFGFEIIKVDDETLQIKNDLKGYGRIKSFFRENISELKAIHLKQTNILHQLENSFWVNGGEKISFRANNRIVRLGQQLTKHEVDSILKRLRRKFKPAAAVKT